MKKSEMASIVAYCCGCNQAKAKLAVEELFKAIRNDDRTVIPGFGTFKQVNRASRKCRNPQTGETVIVPAKVAFTFKAIKES